MEMLLKSLFFGCSPEHCLPIPCSYSLVLLWASVGLTFFSGLCFSTHSVPVIQNAAVGTISGQLPPELQFLAQCQYQPQAGRCHIVVLTLGVLVTS